MRPVAKKYIETLRMLGADPVVIEAAMQAAAQMEKRLKQPTPFR